MVHAMLASDSGRARFWAESAVERDGHIEFVFPNGLRWRGRVLENSPPTRFAVEYLGGSQAIFELADDGGGGTDLALTDRNVPLQAWAETHAGWISVLMALKAAVDFDVDLRGHDPQRCWDQGYVDN